MQVVILITDGREQGNSLDFEAEEAKKDLDSMIQPINQWQVIILAQV